MSKLEPTYSRISEGTNTQQDLYRFDNGWGASVLHMFKRGEVEPYYELGELWWTGNAPMDFELQGEPIRPLSRAQLYIELTRIQQKPEPE